MSSDRRGAWLSQGDAVLESIAILLTSAALAVLAVRAVVRLELRYDTFYYHLPFAARRAGVPIHYELSDKLRDFYNGYPPLADFVQGIFWRVTGSINATGVVNYLAFILFLYFCHRKLR